VKYLQPIRSSASVIAEAGRTIEQRLIRTVRSAERSILRFRIGKLSLATDQRPICSRCDIQQSTMRVPRLVVADATNGRPNALYDAAYCTAPNVRGLKSCQDAVR
jgi:hypothetical protein